MTFFPWNLSSPWIATSVERMTHAASLISSSVKLFSIPAVPCVSILTSIPYFSPAKTNASADIYVCATPVGHAVTPTTFIVIPPDFL